MWLLAAYVAGMGVYKGRVWFVVIIACVMMTGIVIWIWVLWSRGKIKLIHFGFLLGLPFLWMLGYFFMNQQMEPASMDTVFDDKISGTVIGQLEMIEEKELYTLLTLKNNKITLAGKSNNQELILQSTQEENEYESLSFSSDKITVYSTSEESFKIGNILSISGQILKFQMATNSGQFNEYQYNKMRKIDYKINAEQITIVNANYSRFHQLLYSIKKKFVGIYHEILPMKEAGIMSAMILGEMSLLDDEMKKLYQESGISHILSISGLNVSLLGMTLYLLLRKVRIPILLATVISICLIFSYGVLTNFSVSTNRAVVMLILLMIAGVIGRTYDLLSATSLSALIILIQSPMQIYNAGFLLSFGAMLGIALINPVIVYMIPIKNKILEGLCLSISIQIMTFPIILYFFYEFPVYSLIINMIILPLSSLIVLMAIIAGILGCIFLPFSIFTIGCVHYILNFYEFICRITSGLPGKTLLTGKPSLLIIFTYYFIVLLFVVINNGIKRKASILLLSFLIIVLARSKNDNYKVTFLDVGQGDGIFMETPNGTNYLIDGGSSDVKKVGLYRILPFLKASGIWELDYAIVTHTDADHISGLKELIEGMEDNSLISKVYSGIVVIQHLILPNCSLKDDSYMELVTLAQSKGIEVLFMEKGDIIQDGEVTITCIHPNHNYNTTSRNAYSTVLSVSYDQFDLLLTGDLEADGEELVMNELERKSLDKSDNLMKIAVDYDILKVAHHGSKYSTSNTFLELVKPELSVISCGKGNSYGHPHVELLDRLEEIESDVLITKECGAIMIETDGKQMKIKKYLDQED